MKKFILLGFFALSFSFYSSGNVFADAQAKTSATTSNALPSSQEIFAPDGLFESEKNIVRDYTGSTGSTTGNTMFRNLMEKIISFLGKLLAPITIALLSWSAIYLFLSRNNEEEVKKRKNEVFAVFAGFAVILLSTSLIDNIFFGKEGEILRGSCGDLTSQSARDACILNLESTISVFAGNATKEIEGLIDFVTTFAVAIAVLFLGFTAYTLIFAGEDEEQTTKSKKRIIYSIVGIAILISMPKIIAALTDSNKKLVMPDVSALLQIGGYWTNKILGFIGVLAVSSLVWAGFQMIIHFGDEEKVENAKKIFQYVIIGLVLAFSSWTIIRFFLTAG